MPTEKLNNTEYKISVRVKPIYLPHQSDPANDHYAFSYSVTLSNTGKQSASLLTRHWIITDAEGVEEQVKGAGVIGQYPHLKPGQTFQYTSGSILTTPVGSMSGSYQMRADDGTKFDAPIPTFTLSAIALH